jgi:hypothetical protein
VERCLACEAEGSPPLQHASPTPFSVLHRGTPDIERPEIGCATLHPLLTTASQARQRSTGGDPYRRLQLFLNQLKTAEIKRRLIDGQAADGHSR